MDDPRELADALRDFYVRSQRVADRLMRDAGLSLARYKLLHFIVEQGSVRSADIVDGFSLAPRTVTEALDSLERDGLIRRNPDPVDRRAKRISITAEGEKAIASAAPVRERFLQDVFGRLTPSECASLATVLGRMSELLSVLEASATDRP